jgi:GDP-4-dehydro-6-deoxy-D-mannose reductase
MTVLITGASGFSGTALIRYLIGQGERHIRGISRSPLPSIKQEIEVQMIQCDLLDAPHLSKVVGEICPDRIIHLAGITHGSFDGLLTANVTGLQNLLDAVNEVNPLCRILVVSSSAVYGYAGKKPIDENTPIKPLGNYGTSKAAQEQVALERYANGGAQVSIARPFNLIGPGQPDSFVCGRIVRQIVEIEHGRRDTLELLETTSARDFIDVRDTVRAYWAIVSHPDFASTCSGRIFNTGSGKAHTISDVISSLENISHRRYPVKLPHNPATVPIPIQISDNTLVHQVTGWKAGISLENSLADMLSAARLQVNNHA